MTFGVVLSFRRSQANEQVHVDPSLFLRASVSERQRTIEKASIFFIRVFWISNIKGKISLRLGGVIVSIFRLNE